MKGGDGIAGDGTSRKERTPAARGAARREAILDAAVRLFSQNGWRATGLIGLAKEVGLTHAGLLHHFGTKENLLKEVVARRDEHSEPVVDELWRFSGLDSLRMLPLAGEEQLENPTLTRLFTVLVAESLQPTEPLHEYFKLRHRRGRAYWAAALMEGQEAGDIRSDLDPALAAVEIMSFIVGLQTMWLLDPEGVDIRATYEQHARHLLSALAVPHPCVTDERFGGTIE